MRSKVQGESEKGKMSPCGSTRRGRFWIPACAGMTVEIGFRPPLSGL